MKKIISYYDVMLQIRKYEKNYPETFTELSKQIKASVRKEKLKKLNKIK
jgi:hypothetical protein